MRLARYVIPSALRSFAHSLVALLSQARHYSGLSASDPEAPVAAKKQIDAALEVAFKVLDNNPEHAHRRGGSLPPSLSPLPSPSISPHSSPVYTEGLRQLYIAIHGRSPGGTQHLSSLGKDGHLLLLDGHAQEAYLTRRMAARYNR